MRFPEWLQFGGRVAVLLLALGSLAGAQGRPLPDVVRETPGKKATRVFTNEDLETPAPAKTPSPAAAAAESVENENPTTQVTVPGLLPKSTLGQARALLQSLQRDEQVLLERYAQIEQRLAVEDDPHLRRLYSNSLARRDKTVARKRQQIRAVEKAIAAAKQQRGSAARSQDEPTDSQK